MTVVPMNFRPYHSKVQSGTMSKEPGIPTCRVNGQVLSLTKRFGKHFLTLSKKDICDMYHEIREIESRKRVS